MRKEPINATFLAAELTRANRQLGTARAAIIATELCAIGRAFTRVAERLCGGEEEWGRYPEAGKRMARAERRKEVLRKRAEELVLGLARIEGDSLHLSCVTRNHRPQRGQSYRESTVLR